MTLKNPADRWGAISAGAPPPRTPPNQPATARPTLDPSPSTREVPETPPKPAPETDRTRAVPEQVTKRFIRTDNRYYFPDQTPAFVDRGTTLATRSENQEIVRAFVAIAQARDWQSIRVRGTLAFRQAAWAEAALAGIEVRGYQPSEVEQARLAVLLEARDKPPRAGAEPSKLKAASPRHPPSPRQRIAH